MILKSRELGSGKSRLETAFTLGITFKVIPKMKVADGINAARMLIPKCHFDKDKCQRALKYLNSTDRNGMIVEKCSEIIQDMTSRLMRLMRLDIWLLGWRID